MLDFPDLGAPFNIMIWPGAPDDRAGARDEDVARTTALLLLREILVEPVGEDREILVDTGPAMTRARLDDELGGDVGLLELLHEQLSLLDRHKMIGVTMRMIAPRGSRRVIKNPPPVFLPSIPKSMRWPRASLLNCWAGAGG